MRLNAKKSELLIVGTKCMLKKLKSMTIIFEGETISCKPSIKCLRAYLDCNFT